MRAAGVAAVAGLFMLFTGGASAAPLSPAQQTLLQDAARGMRDSRAVPEARVIEGRRLAGNLGAENRPEAAVFLIQLGDPVLLSDFAVRASNLAATPELEALALQRLDDPRGRCFIAAMLRGHRSRPLYDAVLAEAKRPEPSMYPPISSPLYCVRSVSRSALSGIEGDLAALLPVIPDPFEARVIVEALITRRYAPDEAALTAWLDRHPLDKLDTSAWLAVKFDTPAAGNALWRQLARYRDQPLTAEAVKNAEGLIAALRTANPGMPFDAAVLAESQVGRFAPPLQEKVAAFMRERALDVARAGEVTTPNLLYWVQKGANDRVRDFLAKGADPNGRGATANDRPVLVALTNSRWETLRILLDAGADPNVVDWLGNPALKLVAERKAHDDSLDAPVLAAARLLLDKGANASAPGESRYTALHAAAARNFRPMASLLLERGADVNAEADENGLPGLKPLQIAEDQKFAAMAELLRSKGGTTSVAFSAKRAARRTATTILAPVLRGH